MKGPLNAKMHSETAEVMTEIVPPAPAAARGVTTMNLNDVDPEIWLRQQQAVQHELTDYSYAREVGAPTSIPEEGQSGDLDASHTQSRPAVVIPSDRGHDESASRAAVNCGRRERNNCDIVPPAPAAARGVTTMNLNDVDPEIWLRQQQAVRHELTDYSYAREVGAPTSISEEGQSGDLDASHTQSRPAVIYTHETTSRLGRSNLDSSDGNTVCATVCTEECTILVNSSLSESDSATPDVATSTEEWLIKQRSRAEYNRLAGTSCYSPINRENLVTSALCVDGNKMVSFHDVGPEDDGLAKQHYDKDKPVHFDEDSVLEDSLSRDLNVYNAIEDNVVLGVLADDEITAPSVPPPPFRGLTHPHVAGSGAMEDTDLDGVFTAQVQRIPNLEASASTGFFAVHSFLRRDNEVMLVDGEVPQEVQNRRLLVKMSCLVFVVIVILVSVASAIVTKQSSYPSPQQRAQEGPSTTILSPTEAPSSFPSTLAPTTYIAGKSPSMLGQTVAEGFDRVLLEYAGLITLFTDLSRLSLEDRFFKVIGRNEQNFTVFGFTPTALRLLIDNTDLVRKVFEPKFTGHLIYSFESLVIEDRVLSVEDFFDGMVITAKSGRLLAFEVNDTDVVVNGVPIDRVERNSLYKNGYVHNLADYPGAFVEWSGKSAYNVLLETNEHRGGDLSHFIDLIDTSGSLKDVLQRIPGEGTLFCFTNDALSEVEWSSLYDQANNVTGLIEVSSEAYHLLQNHLVQGNFARNVWTDLIVGTNISDTELELETQAGEVIDIVIEPGELMIINGWSLVIQEDLFAENGVLHIIDNPLFSI